MSDNQAISQTLPGLPLPAGTDDNGNPYWFIDGRKVFWAEMQQYIWQLQQKQKQAAGGRGPEGMSQIVMPNIEAQLTAQPNPEVISNPESRIESSPEKGVESRDARVERQPQQTQAAATPKPASPVPAAKPPSLLGDSPELTQVDTSSPSSIASYVQTHQKDSPDNSSRFLAELLEKIVKVFSLEH